MTTLPAVSFRPAPAIFRGPRAAVFALLALAASVAPASAGESDVFDILRKGGYTLLLRHAQSDWRTTVAAIPAGPAKSAAKGVTKSHDAQGDAQSQAVPCAGERVLSEEGRADARALGIAIKSLNLTIADVTAANLCRMQETARIAFGAAKVAPDLAPRPGMVLSLSAQGAAVQRLARPMVPEHGVRVVVGDYEVAQALYGVTLAEGDALVLKSSPDGSIEAVARVRLSDWRQFAPVAFAPATDTRKF